MSRQRDIKEAQGVLNLAVEQMLSVEFPVFADVDLFAARENLERSYKQLRAALDSERTENAAVARDTSIRAAKSVRTGSQRFLVLEIIVNHFVQSGATDGMTADAVQRKIKGDRHQSISARVSELEADGYIFDSKQRRKTRAGRQAIVWFPTGRGVGRVSEQ